MRIIEGGKKEGSEYDLGITVSRMDHLKVHTTDSEELSMNRYLPLLVAIGGKCYQCGKLAGDVGLYICDVCDNFYCISCKARDHDKPGHEKIKPLINRSKFKVVDGNQV